MPIPAIAAEWGTAAIDSSQTWLVVAFENSVFKAVVREHPGGTCGHEHAIRDWILKSNDKDQVSQYIDACSQRGPLKNAAVLHDNADSIKIRLEYRDCGDRSIPSISEYTMYPGSPVIKIDYLKYTSWANTVDLGTPGETYNRSALETRVYGQEEYIRSLQYHEASYWNTYDRGDYIDDPKDGGSLNYKGHMIIAVANRQTGAGYGRVMPIFGDNTGGIKIVKLLWDKGFETFPATGQASRPPFTGYLYLFDTGLDNAIEMGQKIVDGDFFINETTYVGGVADTVIPVLCRLDQNYPNPFNPETTIEYHLFGASDVIVKLYNCNGQEVETLAEGWRTAGSHTITWRPRGLSSGIYFYRLQAGVFDETKKVVLYK